MKIIVLGASGMIGSYLVKHLQKNGHHVIGASRSSNQFKLDLFQLPERSFLQQQFEGVDCVCNCIGIAPGFEEKQQFLVHFHALKKVLSAAKEAGVKKIIQISALSNAQGADLEIPYLASKYSLDKELLESKQSVAVIRASLVYAPEGVSTKGFLQMARLPYLVLPNKGQMMIQPLHVMDVCDFVSALLRLDHQNRIFEIGGFPISLADYLDCLHPNPKRQIFNAPDLLSRIGMFLLHYIQPAIGGINAYRLLLSGSTTSHNQFTAILKRQAIAPSAFHQTDLLFKGEQHEYREKN